MRLQRICIVDDSGAMQSLANRVFAQQLGKELVVATNGFHALEVILEQEPDACFIDVEMPELNGLQLVSILRANPKFEQMPIAMLSSAASIFDREKGLIAGADLYLTKPFSKDSIEQALREMEVLHE
ncbi:response regulator [Pseudomonas sp. MWU12-2323]|uniref:response regulator n=1 Tax=Pseudomonas sp. MWU12-2323 TaxID=2651296 RepID=UPI00128D6E9F|nr:response regulator [Pseudomonas sp. MWU12-2323]MPQ69269.1 response regulator [Pseudomonas sp. MWU12-2323]